MAVLFKMTAENVANELRIKINNLMGEIDSGESTQARDDRVSLLDMYADMLDIVIHHLEENK